MTRYHGDDRRYRQTLAFRHRWIAIRNQWFTLVWLAVAATVVYLNHRWPMPEDSQALRGMVEPDAAAVAPVERARIRALHVVEGQSVREGDVLVEMDTALIGYGVTADVIDTISIETAFGDTHQDVLQAVSQRRDAIAAIEADIAICRQEWRREEAERDAMRAEQVRREDLRRQNLVDEMTVSDLRPALANLEQAVAEYPVRMATLERQLADAREYHDHIMQWLGAREGEPISTAIARRLNQQEVIDLLRDAAGEAQAYRDAYTLRAPQDGIVSMLLFSVGDVVPDSIPIMRIVPPTPRRITAYLDEQHAAELAIGEEVVARSAGRPSTAATIAVVERVGPEVVKAAFELSATGRQVPVRARRAVLTLREPHGLLAGETVWLQPRRDRWWQGLLGW
jgi:multidrug resistance efflux pump